MNSRGILATLSAGTRAERIAILRTTDSDAVESIRCAAEEVLFANCGKNVFFRGLIEFSNRCRQDCNYCGIRRSNKNVHRYEISSDSILEAARDCARLGYGSLVLQSGERQGEPFLSYVVDTVRRIKEETRSPQLPDGLGITLCVGEQNPDTYQRFWEAGAHRYLLRIETSNPLLFSKIHPPDQTLQTRIACLNSLREIGFQVGTGVMIGLPGQTVEDLADDIEFFHEYDIDMIGMGPYIPHEGTPLGRESCPDGETRLRLSLLTIAVARLALNDVNIAATTALQTLHPFGREKGLQFGANIMMPQLTPLEFRRDYLLYPGKPCLEESASQCYSCLETRIRAIQRTIGYHQWGDSKHAQQRLEKSSFERNGNVPS